MKHFTIQHFGSPDAPNGQAAPNGYAAAIGFFDGIHLGHRYMLRRLQEEAAQAGLATMVISFDRHPKQVLGRPDSPLLLTTPAEKQQLLAEAGINACTWLHFSKEMAQLTAQEFMAQILSQQLHVRLLLVGYDHRFGRPQPGEGFEQYRTYGEALGIRVIEGDPFHNSQLPDIRISSSSIRLLLEQGNVKYAAHRLGYPYQLSGTVVRGFQNGRKLGFPTANLRIDHDEKLLPHLGVYATWAIIDGERHAAMTNIGRRPTLDNGLDITVETHLFNFEADLYDRPMTIVFVDRLRDEKRFNGLEALMQQLKADAQEAQLRLRA